MSHAAHGSPPPDVLVLAAFHPELAPLRPALGEALRGRLGACQVVGRAVGIGLPHAAAGAAARIAELSPRAVVLVGTCGAYAGAGVGLGEVVVARRLLLVDPAVVDGAAQFPDPMSVVSEADPAMLAGLSAAGARPSDVATTLAITVDDAMAGRIARVTGAHVEHLEAHGVACACAALGVPFAAVLGVANLVGAGARAQWLQHHRAAAEAVVAPLTAWLSRPRP